MIPASFAIYLQPRKRHSKGRIKPRSDHERTAKFKARFKDHKSFNSKTGSSRAPFSFKDTAEVPGVVDGLDEDER